MKIAIGAVGRMRAGAEADLVQDYVDRAIQAGRKAGVTDVSVTQVTESKKRSAKERKSEECAALLNQVGPGAVLVALDERGDDLSSRQLAKLIGSVAQSGTPQLVFAIGGPDGLDAEVLSRASQRICLGRLTWPHRLARVMIAEQIYRAVTILVNHPYHRD